MDEVATTSGSSARVLGGRYRLERVIGHGGMGVVWAAQDEVLGRAVAVKQLGPPGGVPEEYREELRERAMRESRAAARIASPHAVVVHDVLEEAGRLWLVMQLLPSRTLADALKETGPLPAAVVARIGLDLVEALLAIHAAGIVHRDVKPANVLLLEDGHAVLADFGIASSEGDSRLTMSGQVMGSPGYIAPERARGGAVAGASDLWSLGALLYTALEGAPPFADPDLFENLTAVMTEPPPSPSRGGPLVPVVDRLLDPDPTRRATGEQARELLLAASVRLYAGGSPLDVLGLDADTPAPVVRPPVARPPAAPVPLSQVSFTEAPFSPVPLVPGTAPPPYGRRRRSAAALALPAVAALAALGVLVAVVVAALRPDPAASPSVVAAQPPPTLAGQPPTPGAPAPSANPSGPAAGSPSGTAAGPGGAPAPPGPAPGGTGATAVAPPVTPGGGAGTTSGPKPAASPPRAVVAPDLPGWTKTVAGGVTTYRATGVPGVLELTRPRPGVAPLALLTTQEGRAAPRLTGYTRLSLGPATVGSRPGAQWEYTWTATPGLRHALVRAVRVPAGTVTVRWLSARVQSPVARAAFEQLTALMLAPAG